MTSQYGVNVTTDRYRNHGIRLIRTSDIKEDGSLIGEDDAIYIGQEDAGDLLLEQGDLLFSRSGTLGRCLRYVGPSRTCSFAGYLVRFRVTSGLDARYIAYCSQARFFADQIDADSFQSTIANFNAEKYNNIRLPWHKPAVQCAIADYLDGETARIDALLAKKRALVDLLQQRSSTFAARAVTCGLDPAVATKWVDNSFVSEIPRHWHVIRLRHAVDEIIDTAHKTAPVVEGGHHLIVRTSNVKDGRLRLDDARYTDEASWREWTRRGSPRPGDVMFTREAPAGEACLVPEGVPLCIGQRMVLLRRKSGAVLGSWLLYSIYAGPAQQFISLMSRSTTVAHMNMSDIPDIPLVLPPLEEQHAILQRVHFENERLRSGVELLGRQIALLAERRQALITAVVTGELAVPGVAA